MKTNKFNKLVIKIKQIKILNVNNKKKRFKNNKKELINTNQK